MPFDAVDDKFAPPRNDVVVPAAAKVPTVRTTAGLSTRKSAGRLAVAVVPMPSKFCVNVTLVDNGIAANVITGQIAAMSEISAAESTRRCVITCSREVIERTHFELGTERLGIGILSLSEVMEFSWESC